MADNNNSVAIWSAIASVASVVGTLVAQAAVTWIKGRNQVKGKQATESSRMELSDRQELKRYIEDSRMQNEKLNLKIDQQQTFIDTLRTQVTDLTVKLAISERDKVVLAADNAELTARVTSLEAQVARISPRGVGSSAGDNNPLHP